MKTQKLKACPFCGSEANQPEDVSVPKYGPWWQVMCSNEQCRAWRPGSSPAKAAAEWNKRAGDRQPATIAEAKGIVPFASASGCAASKDLALQNWMQDVTSLLCYQPEVPHAHKESLVKTLDHYNKQCAELDESKRHNDQAHRQPPDETAGA